MWWKEIFKLWETTNQCCVNQVGLGRIWLHERGQGLVEFALTLPVLLLLVLGVIDLGMGFKTYIGLTNASREGVRWVSIHPSDQAGAEARISAEAGRIGLESSAFMAGGYEVSFSPNKSSYDAGEKVTVDVHYDYELLFGLITSIPEIPFTASSTMVVLYDE